MICLDGRCIRIIQGNSGTISFWFFAPDDSNLNLQDYTVTFMVKKKKTDTNADAIITKTFTNTNGHVIDVSLLPTDTDAEVGAYWWSIRLDKNTYVNEVLSGPFFILEGVQD